MPLGIKSYQQLGWNAVTEQVFSFGPFKLLKHGILKTYKDFPHGMPTTEAETINADLLAFLQS